MFWKPSKKNNNYPFDLNGDLSHTRLAKTVGIYPYPPLIGCITGIMPLQDAFFMRNAVGKSPFGPGITTVPLNLQWQSTLPGLAKTG